MAEQTKQPIWQTNRAKVRETVPQLIEYTERVLFGEIWERPGLSKRDRSLITIAALIALGKRDQLPGHFERGTNNGLSKAEIGEVITHLAFYSGWPTAMTAAQVAAEFYGDHPKS
jgi:4-carboxymuconolactone decarboxylase